MNSLPPVNRDVKAQLPEHAFKRSGIRLHRNIASNSIGARTPGQQIQDAAKEALRNDPVLDGVVLPQNRIGRYTDIGPNDLT